MMNRIEFKDLVVGQLVWYVVYEGESKPPSQTLMVVVTAAPELTVQNIRTGEVIEPFPIYAYFEPVHAQYLANQIKALEAQQLRIAEELATLKSLKG